MKPEYEGGIWIFYPALNGIQDLDLGALEATTMFFYLSRVEEGGTNAC